MINKLEKKLNKCLLELYYNDQLDQKTYEHLRASGTNLGKLYGLPKIHKKDISLRSILSTVNTHNYKLAKFLESLFQPLCNSEQMINDAFSFASFIRSQQFDTNIKLASVDMESLFTNVPVNETINVILQYCFPKDVKLFKGFTCNVFKNLLELAISYSYLLLIM